MSWLTPSKKRICSNGRGIARPPYKRKEYTSILQGTAGGGPARSGQARANTGQAAGSWQVAWPFSNSKPALWVREEEDIGVEFLSCSVEDRVFQKAEGWEYCYMYTTVLIDLGVTFSFSEFENGVLSQTKCAPTQIHPNACGLVRSFEVLMDYLESVQILGMKKVNEECALVIDFLEQNLCSKEVVEQVDQKSVVVNQPSNKKKPISMKRKRAEEEETSLKGKVIDLTGSRCFGKEVSLEGVMAFAENQRKLHGYVGAEDLSSMWFECYLLTVVAEEHF
ncbi:hypothetical protein PIB30_060763 [Stylosanthes scabra]|uniref:Uncharacterized protein n=1 Tax=Stylosanthes scabra TaxID=79078 RepID=A0ABU6XKT4_9FABA|nr:hypothetical protein [Stylosanthes scabra]